eukprot:TRINITY_DN31646_c0_g1_i2.p6 TRINITY_DN31646_c0_g1~~TRINITY_DN31646_c0_g1_i2.p6  ORF type:complete len:107 (-),score=13.01 TRINITY_DN31646_c0_g1_i2:184-504(-)
METSEHGKGFEAGAIAGKVGAKLLLLRGTKPRVGKGSSGGGLATKLVKALPVSVGENIGRGKEGKGREQIDLSKRRMRGVVRHQRYVIQKNIQQPHVRLLQYFRRP